MNLADLILKAGGFSTDLKPLKIELSNKANNYTEDIDISSFGFSNNIGIYKIIPDDPNFKRILNDQDIVSVYSKEVNIFPTATITGQVMYPGLYVLEKDKNGMGSNESWWVDTMQIYVDCNRNKKLDSI